MTQPLLELDRFARSLLIAGGCLVLLGAVAVVWPEQVLVPALITVGVVSAIVGAYQVSTGFSVTHEIRGARLILAHGVLLVAFGFLTAGVTAFPFFTALAIVGGWLFLHALECGVVTIVLPMRSNMRALLIGWALVHVLTAILIVRYSVGTTLALVFLGALYAAIFGGAQLIAGYVIHRSATRR